MDKIRIKGGRPLNGTVTISGAKNASLPELCAALLTDAPVALDNVPDVRDVSTLARLLTSLGVEANVGGGKARIRAATLTSVEAPYDMVKTMRASVLVLGPLLAREGRARVSLPGGCAIGERPIDFHLQALRKMGATLDVAHGYVEATAKRLQGCDIAFDTVTVTGTENVMMAACLAQGRTVIRNAACEPEVSDLAVLLRSMGASIEGAGTQTIVVEGVDRLHGAEHRVVPDRIEAATFVAACAVAGGAIEIRGCRPEHLRALLDKTAENGLHVEEGADRLAVRSVETLKPSNMTTHPYPGFPTDMQAQYMVMMTQAHGTSAITEAIFENRFMHVAELRRMGASIRLDGRTALVAGPTPLSGAQVMATDLRASASLVIAGLAASGETLVDRVYHLDRGYHRIDAKLRALGADVERVS